MGTIYDLGALEGTIGRIVAKTVWAGYKALSMAKDALVAVHTWQDRARERHQLQLLDERMLRDIGLTRGDLEHETRKPFWRG